MTEKCNVGFLVIENLQTMRQIRDLDHEQVLGCVLERCQRDFNGNISSCALQSGFDLGFLALDLCTKQRTKKSAARSESE